MKVNIYITTKFHGRIPCGTGMYAILLETVIDGKIYRKIHVSAWKELSFQKLAVRALVEAVRYMNEPSVLIIQCDSPYAVNAANSGTAEGKKHEVLWREYFGITSQMEKVTVIFNKEHKYRKYLLRQISKGGYRTKTDKE